MPVDAAPPGPVAAFEQICLEHRGEFDAVLKAARDAGFLPFPAARDRREDYEALLGPEADWHREAFFERSDVILGAGSGESAGLSKGMRQRASGCGVQTRPGSGPAADQDFQADSALRRSWGKPALLGNEGMGWVFVGEPRPGGATSLKDATTKSRSGRDVTLTTIGHAGPERFFSYFRLTPMEGK
jgi:hypothetical protein